MLVVKSGVSRPKGLNPRTNGQEIYPFDKMQKKDDFFMVPWYWYFGLDKTAEECELERWDPKLHRKRVNDAARGYALKENKKAEQDEGFDRDTFKPLRFTVGATKDEAGNPGVGVWRD